MNHPSENKREKRDLVVVIHGMGGRSERMRHVVDVVHRTWKRDGKPEPIVYCPEMGFSMASFDDPCEIAKRLLNAIDAICEQHAEIEKIILLGYSFGSLIVRKAYVYACGECTDAEFEPHARNLQPREWVKKVDRIVLLAGMNRGWHISAHLSLPTLVQWLIGVAIGNAIMIATLGRKVPLIFRVHRGAPFLTLLRLQWMAMRRRAGPAAAGSAIVIQLLGTIDDMVSPEDNIDLVAGQDFYYLDVPKSGHVNVLEANESPAGMRRRHIIARALTATPKQLERLSILPSDHNLQAIDDTVTDVVFVIHGIRDEGYWTQKIARRVVALARERNRTHDRRSGAMTQNADEAENMEGQGESAESAARRFVKTETSSYGYFAMLPFLLPNVRRKRVEWLMDRYAENRAMYPKADFSYVGHSHGTYMLARAMESYPCVRFKHVAFAGSVVRIGFDWSALVRAGRVQRVLNFVASGDWVVAIFPRTFQMLNWQDLGSAGHDGFAQAKGGLDLVEAHFVEGGHGAALREEYWRVIAGFILDGQAPTPHDLKSWRSSLVVSLGKAAPLITLGILAVVAWFGVTLLAPVTQSWKQSLPAFYFVLYVAFIWKILTWF